MIQNLKTLWKHALQHNHHKPKKSYRRNVSLFVSLLKKYGMDFAKISKVLDVHVSLVESFILSMNDYDSEFIQYALTKRNKLIRKTGNRKGSHGLYSLEHYLLLNG